MERCCACSPSIGDLAGLGVCHPWDRCLLYAGPGRDEERVVRGTGVSFMLGPGLQRGMPLRHIQWAPLGVALEGRFC